MRPLSLGKPAQTLAQHSGRNTAGKLFKGCKPAETAVRHRAKTILHRKNLCKRGRTLRKPR